MVCHKNVFSQLQLTISAIKQEQQVRILLRHRLPSSESLSTSLVLFEAVLNGWLEPDPVLGDNRRSFESFHIFSGLSRKRPPLGFVTLFFVKFVEFDEAQ